MAHAPNSTSYDRQLRNAALGKNLRGERESIGVLILMHSCSELIQLPSDCHERILHKCTMSTIQSLCCTCSKWNEIVGCASQYDHRLWSVYVSHCKSQLQILLAIAFSQRNPCHCTVCTYPSFPMCPLACTISSLKNVWKHSMCTPTFGIAVRQTSNGPLMRYGEW